MVEVRRSWMVGAGVLVVVLLAVFFVAAHLLNADTYRGQIEASLSQALGRKVELGKLSFSLFTGSLVAESPSIADDPRFSAQPFLTAKDIRIGVEVGAYVFHHEIHITKLTIEDPKITLLRGLDGTWNYSSLGAGKQAAGAGAGGDSLLPNFTVQTMAIRNGTVSLGTVPARGTPRVWTDLDVSAEHFSLTGTFPFTASGKLPEGGTVAIHGTAGPVDAKDASLTPFTAQIALKHADLLAAGLVEPGQGVSGVADLDAKVVSNGQDADVDGNVAVSELKLAKNGTASAVPVKVQFAVVQDLRALSGQIQKATVEVGKATMDLTGSYATKGNETTVDLKANGQSMPMDDLVSFLPSLGVQLPSGSRLRGGTLTTSLAIQGPVSGLVIRGPVRMAGAQLAGFDLGSKLASVRALTGAKTGGDTTIQALSTDLHYGPEGTRTDNLALVVEGLGSAAGSGTISPGGGLNYQLVIKLDSSGAVGMATQALGMLTGALGTAISQTARNGIPVSITGTTANPVFTPEVGKMLGGAAVASPARTNNPLGNVLGGLLGR